MHKQLLIPGFADGAQRIGEGISIVEKDGWVTYFVGGDDYFRHTNEYLRSRRFILTSLMQNNHLKAADISSPPLLTPHRTLMNWKAQFRKDGPASFFTVHDSAKTVIMTPEKSLQCATLLAQGLRVSVVARQVEIDESTLRCTSGFDSSKPQFPRLSNEIKHLAACLVICCNGAIFFNLLNILLAFVVI